MMHAYSRRTHRIRPCASRLLLMPPVASGSRTMDIFNALESNLETSDKKALAMTASRTKRKAQRASRASNPRKSAARPAAKATKPALGDWRGQTLARMRALILEADPEMIEERKWRKPSNPAGVPVWSHNGIVCTGETYKQIVKLTFAQGAGIPDPSRLFNSSLEGSTRRAIDIHEGEHVDAVAFKALIKAAVFQNAAAQNGPTAKKAKSGL